MVAIDAAAPAPVFVPLSDEQVRPRRFL